MLESLTLGIAGLWSQAFGGNTFHETEIALSPTPTEVVSPMEYTALGIFDPTKKAMPPVYFRASVEEAWRELHIDDQGGNATEILTGDPRKRIWLKAEEPFQGRIVYYDTRIPGENLVAQFDPFDDDDADDPFTGLEYKLDRKPKYVARDDWGANEDLRVWKPFRGLTHFFREIVPEAKQLPRHLHPKIIARNDDEGRELTWPVEESKEVKKFIIHHTGEVIDRTRNPKEIMRAIYAYHTLNRGWGDIGYNYVIDRQGNIYQGRAGGPKIVGAHVAFHNVGTVGVALMGNFNREAPTEAQLEVLTILLAEHANRFNIDPTARSRYLGRYSYNISGHRDVAKRGHGTACPGKILHKKLDWIRKETKAKSLLLKGRLKTGRDFLASSKANVGIQRARKFQRKAKKRIIDFDQLMTKKVLQRGDRVTLSISIENNSKFNWPKGAELIPTNIPDGLLIGKFRATSPIHSGRNGTFKARAIVKDTPNGKYDIRLVPKIFNSPQDIMFRNKELLYPLQISGNKNMLMKNNFQYTTIKKEAIKPLAKGNSNRAKAFSSRFKKKSSAPPAPVSAGPDIKIKLAAFNHSVAHFSSDSEIKIHSRNKVVTKVPRKTKITFNPLPKQKKIKVTVGKKEYTLTSPSLITDGVIEITNYSRSRTYKYNKFRKRINAHLEKNRLILVNELPLEEYLWGLGEEPSSEPEEKKHAIFILARSYGYVYSGTRRKFKTRLYDLEDSAATSQLYLGYEWEKYNPKQKQLISETNGKMISYNNRVVVGPYFTQSAGKTSSKWSRQYPWTKSQHLPHDEGLHAKGHGVGLSGNTARALAEMGQDHEQIIKHFFKGIDIRKVY